MKQLKHILFGISMTAMIVLMVIEIKLNIEWHEMEEQYSESGFFYTQESTQMENRIFRIDMTLATIGFINFVIIALYLFNNYQDIVDRWRKFRGVEFKTLLAVQKEKDP